MKRLFNSAGYTLIEIIASAAFIAVGIGAAVSLSATAILQEEMSWRISVARNYQENLISLWQLGLTETEAQNLMLSVKDNAKLYEIIGPSPSLTTTGQAVEDGVALMESGVSVLSVNTANMPGGAANPANTMNAYRPVIR